MEYKMKVESISPTMAVQAAQVSYLFRYKSSTIGNTKIPPDLRNNFDFSGDLVTGISGTVLERLFNHRTGFGVIGTGRPESLSVLSVPDKNELEASDFFRTRRLSPACH
jgi:hypothetical protein